MIDYDEKWKEYRNRAIQALGTAIVITLIVVANIGLIACIRRLSAQQTKYLLYAQCGLVDILGSVGMIQINDGRVIVAIPSMRKIGDSKWAVYFMEDNQIYTAIYYTEEKARHRYEKELEKCTR